MKRPFYLFLAMFLLLSLGIIVSANASEPEMLHVCDENNNERCLAANADGTRFLIWQNHHPEHNMWVQDADGGNRQDLYFSGLEEEQDIFLRFIGVVELPSWCSDKKSTSQ